MRKILIINTVPYVTGGMSKVIMNYYKALNLQKFQVDFVVNTFAEDEYLQIMRQNRAKVVFFNRSQSTIQYFLKLIHFIKTENYDVVHVHGNSCTMAIELLAARLAGCSKRIAHSHNTSCSHMKAHRLLRPFFEFAVTDRLACSVPAGKWLFRNKSFVVLPNAFKVKDYQFNLEKRHEVRASLQFQESDLVIGHVGLFNEQKNQSFLVDVLQNLRKKGISAKLLLVGEGDQVVTLKEKARRNGLLENIVFYGTTQDIPGVMSAMDVFAFPSKWEGLGIVLLEAQISGLPCVASDVVPKEVALSNNIQFISLKSLEAWSQAIVSCWNDASTLRMEFYQKHQCAVDQFEIIECVHRLEELYS